MLGQILRCVGDQDFGLVLDTHIFLVLGPTMHIRWFQETRIGKSVVLDIGGEQKGSGCWNARLSGVLILRFLADQHLYGLTVGDDELIIGCQFRPMPRQKQHIVVAARYQNAFCRQPPADVLQSFYEC